MFTAFMAIGATLFVAEFGYMGYVYFCGKISGE